jgi:rhamnulokinase
MSQRILAFDHGAESGRGIVALFDGQKVELDVIHRFPNVPVRLPDGFYWDPLRLFDDMKNALRLAVQKHGNIDCLGVDTWGVDFALLGRGGMLLGNPRHYRDPHTEAYPDAAFATLSRKEIFEATGLQFMRFNSLFQLLAMKRDRSPVLESAESLLFIPDLFNYWFTGVQANEASIASTSQFYDPRTRGWANGLLDRFGLNRHMLHGLVEPGHQLGPLLPAVAQETGAKDVRVIAPATHDTASAVAAVPAGKGTWCYISSGTWSLMGIETATPILDERPLKYNFTNEGGVGGTTRFLKNVMGLWLVQECRRTWERAGKAYSYEELTRLAESAPGFGGIVDPDHSSFWIPPSMPEALANYCKHSGQPVPVEPGAIVRCALESLALRYRWVLERLEEILGYRIDVIHIVGGGCQNRLLNQLTADCSNRLVLAGPAEATALGNVMVQSLGLGQVGSLEQAREVIRASFQVERFEPRQSDRWAEPYARFCRLLQSNV